MKKILIALIIVFSLLLTSCELFGSIDILENGTNQGNTDIGTENGDDTNEENNETNGDSDGKNDAEDEDPSNGSPSTDDNDDENDESGDNGESSSGGNVATDGHVDEDNDGRCDDCSISVLLELDFVVINDLHGKFTDGSNHPGVDELTSYLKNMYETNDNVFLLSSGDMWQGGSESNLTKGLIITDWMNELGFISMTLGNHEFDWGEEHIENNRDAANFPFLAINIFDKATNQRVNYATPSVMVEQNGMKIGIIGAIGDCYSSISPDKVEDIYFKTGDELTELVKAESVRLRELGADLIVYSLHDGYGSSGGTTITNNKLSSYYDYTLSMDKYVDIVFEGHTHQKYVLKDGYGVYHLQNGGENKGIAHAEIIFNFANNKYSVTESKIINSSVYSSAASDPLINELLKKYEADIAVGNEVLGFNSVKRYDEELEQIVADLYLKVGIEKWGDEYDIFLGGGYLQTRSPYNLNAGEVRFSDLQMLFPFENQITLCSISGKYLKSKFINSTNDSYFISISNYGKGVSTIKDNETYYIIVDSYTAQYAPNRLTVVDTYDETTFACHLLRDYIKMGGLDSTLYFYDDKYSVA